MTDSAIHVLATHNALQFALNGFSPLCSIDNGQPFTLAWQYATPVGVAAGPHRVTVWVPYSTSPQMGLASVDFQLVPGQGVLATWSAPGTVFGAGSFRLEAASGPAGDASQQYGGGYAPQAPAQPQQAAAPGAGWHPDPAGRYLHRWWDGARWSEQVSDGTNVGPDPNGAP